MKSIIPVIDGNHEFLESFRDRLKFERFEVFSSQEGDNGHVISFQKKPEQVLCDVNLSHKNRSDKLEELQKNNTTTSMLLKFKTTHAATSIKFIGLQLGVKGYLTKPSTKKKAD